MFCVHNKHMTDKRKPIKYLALARTLAENGYRLFSVEDVKEIINSNELEIENIQTALASLKKHEWIHPIKKNLFCLDSLFLAGIPIHEWEIATHLVESCTISHYSAFHHHKLTDQIPHVVYASVITGTSLPRTTTGKLFQFRGVSYKYIQISQNHFFGFSNVWIGDIRISITDLERTLLDGLMKPKYCGGIHEVLEAFERAMPICDVEKLVDYAIRLGVFVSKRLGWVLERLGYSGELLSRLEKIPFSSTALLDASGKNDGEYNGRWRVRVNL